MPTQQFGGGVISESDPNLVTEAELVYSVGVTRIVARDLGFDADRSDLLDDLGVDVLDVTKILQVTYSHTDPATARTRAQVFADGYLEYRRRSVTNDLENSAEDVDRELRKLRRRFDEIERQLATLAEESAETETVSAESASLRTEAALIQDGILQRSSCSAPWTWPLRGDRDA